jgi:ammonia channel protein AmtB
MDAAGGAIAFWSVGYAFAYGNNNGPFIGTNKFFLANLKDFGDNAQSWFFQVRWKGWEPGMPINATARRRSH